MAASGERYCYRHSASSASSFDRHLTTVTTVREIFHCCYYSDIAIAIFIVAIVIVIIIVNYIVIMTVISCVIVVISIAIINNNIVSTDVIIRIRARSPLGFP